MHTPAQTCPDRPYWESFPGTRQKVEGRWFLVIAQRELSEHLDRWADLGLITPDQAASIRAHEVDTEVRALPRWVEPVAYLGAALVAVALLLFAIQVWGQLATWSQVGLAGLVTVVLLVTGWALQRSHAAPAQRAASFAWLLAIAGVGATAGLFTFEALDLDEDLAIVLTAVSVVAAASLLYLLSRRALQQIGLAAGIVFLTTALSSVFELEEPWIFSVTFLALGAIWLLLTWGGILRPPGTGWVLGGLLALAVGFGGFAGLPLWSGLGVAVGLALVVLSAALEMRSLLVIGVVGLVIWIPTTVTTLFQGSIAVPVAILVTGVVTLTVVVAAVRQGGRRRDVDKPNPSGSAEQSQVSVDA